MEELHKEVREGRDIESRLGNNADLDVSQWTVAGDTLFHAAAKTGNLVALEQLILKVGPEGKAVLNQRDREGRSPLLSAIAVGRNIAIIERLAQEHIVNVNIKAHDGDGPIHEAARDDNLEAVKVLLEREDIRPDEPGGEYGMQQVVAEE